MNKHALALLCLFNLALSEPAEEGPGYGISSTVDLSSVDAAVLAAPAAVRPRPPMMISSGGFILIRWERAAPKSPDRWTYVLRDLAGRARQLPAAKADPSPEIGGGETWRLPMPGLLPGMSVLDMNAPGYRFTRLLVPDMR